MEFRRETSKDQISREAFSDQLLNSSITMGMSQLLPITPMTGIEPFVFGTVKAFLASKVAEEAKKTLAGAIAKAVWGSGAELIKSAGISEQLKQSIYDASGQYIERYAKRNGELKVLGMPEPVWIEDIYTRVQFLGEDGIRHYLSTADLEQTYRDTQQRRLQLTKREKRDGLAVASENQYLMVLGQPGAGKSTFLRRIGLEALKPGEAYYPHDCIPVFLELKRFVTGDVDLEKAIAHEFLTCGFPDPARSTKKLLENGELLILLDGLDEVPTAQVDQAITQIQDFVDRFSENRFIASCRTAAYRSRFRQFTDVVMTDFSDNQIQQFITNWFRSKRDQQVGTAEKCWEILQQPDYAATRELAQTPLLLTFLCLVFDDSQTFPKQRASLYKDALDVLLKRWAAEKRIQRDPIYQDLTLPLEEIMLAEIAYEGFVNDRLFFSGREVVKQICVCLENNLNAPKHLDGDQILEAIQIQQGILVERARDVLSFSHLTLQEYLTAQHIANKNLIEQVVANHLTDHRWREVFHLIAGLMPAGADALLLQMETEAQKCLNTNKLKSLINWADQATVDSECNFKPVAKRTITIFLVFDLILTFDEIARSLDLDFNIFSYHMQICKRISSLTYEFAHLLDPNIRLARTDPFGLDMARDLEQMHIFGKDIKLITLIQMFEKLKTPYSYRKSPINKREAIFNYVYQVWFKALIFSEEWLILDQSEARAIEDYLYANELIVRCKESALYVSKTWEAIENRMLTVRE